MYICAESMRNLQSISGRGIIVLMEGSGCMPGARGRIAVIGGANMDIGGFPGNALVMGDSNPGRVRMSPGGVGRNIADNAARLGLDVQLFSALGDDANGRALLDDCRDKGIQTDGCRIVSGGHTSIYLFIDDGRGEMLCAVSDMDIQRALTPEYLEPRLEELNAMDAVALDANLPEETIRFLAESLEVPVFADAVSTAKVGKLRGALGRLHCLKPNRIEAELLTGMEIRSVEDAVRAAERLNAAGVRCVYLTLGLQGAVCAGEGACAFLPCDARGAVSATGAGDAFAAALLWAHCEGLDLLESCTAGMAAAAIAVGAAEAVSPELNRKNLIERMAMIRRKRI